MKRNYCLLALATILSPFASLPCRSQPGFNLQACMAGAHTSQAQAYCGVKEQLQTAALQSSVASQLIEAKRNTEATFASYAIRLFPGPTATRDGNIFRDVQFSCTSVPRTNLNGVTLASEIQTTVTNISGRRLVTRYRIDVTSNQQRVEELVNGVGRANFVPGAIEKHSMTPFEKVSVQDEFPKTCEFTQIQVCPADPPPDFPSGHYFRPFIDGGEECKAIGTVTIPLATPTPKENDCAAVLYGDTGRVSAYGYGAGWGAATIEDATKIAHTQMDQKGIVYNSPTAYTGAVFQGCSVPHGAVAAVRDKQKANDEDLVVLTLAVGKGSSREAAESDAVSACQRLPNSRSGNCEVLVSW